MAPKLEDNSPDAPIFKAFANEFGQVSLIYKSSGGVSSLTQSDNIALHLVNGNGLGIPAFISNALGKIKQIDSQQAIDVISTSDALGAGLVGVFAKKLLKSKEIGEDEEKSFEKNIQTITDKHISIVDEKVLSKEKEIMTI